MPAPNSLSFSPAPPRPIFFGRGGVLFGVWRGAAQGNSAREVWLIVSPWAEEDKSARRTLTEGAQHLAAQGAASLLLCPRGQGDSQGEFASATLAGWLEDLHGAIAHARATFPGAPLKAIGVRGGALLLLELARQSSEAQTPIFERVVLIEPILQGKRVVSELQARQKLRANLTQQEGAAASALAQQDNAAPQVLEESAAPKNEPQVLEATPEGDALDFDGWAWGAKLRDDVKAWDAGQVSSAHLQSLARRVDVLQVGPREALLPALEQWCQARQIEAKALRAQPFWNLLDHAGSDEMWQIVAPEPAGDATFARSDSATQEGSEEALVWRGAGGQSIVGVRHRVASTYSASGNGPRATLVFLHGWSGYKSGPHQMLARAARFFAARGFEAVRFDFAGRGDSEGDAALATLATMSDDTRAVLDWCRAQAQSGQKIVVVGLCSGCEVALGSARDDIAALALWSAPVFAAQASSSRDNRKRLHHLAQYARKLLRPATYLKLLRGEVDTKSVAAVARAKGGESKNVESGEPGQLPRGWRSQVLAGFGKWLAARRPLLLVYGTADPTTQEALAWYRALPASEPSVHLVEGANHSYYGLSWEREVFEATASWLDKITPQS
jgi:alpha-beta hydrolase superfamily lysophospholipase